MALPKGNSGHGMFVTIGCEDRAKARAARTFAVAVDGSPASQYAFQWVSENMVMPGDRLVILHVRNDYTILSNVPMVSEVQKLDEVLADELVKQYCRGLKVTDVDVKAELLQGDPATLIHRFCDRDPPTLLVLGTRGRTGLAKFLLGSVSDQVVQLVKCPVTVVKTPDGWAEVNAKTIDIAEIL